MVKICEDPARREPGIIEKTLKAVEGGTPFV